MLPLLRNARRALARRHAWVLAPALLLAQLVGAADAQACACCSEPGQRVEGTAPLDAYVKGELGRVRFAKAAKLYLTAAGFDGVSGIRDPADRYELVQTRQGDVWTFTFKDAKGNAGALAFTLPAKVEEFFVDTQPGKQAGDPTLYKEWRLAAPLTATGIFKPSAVGSPTVRLILQGHGNSCTSAEQLTTWTIVVSGPKASFSLFGTLSTPAATPTP
ncbi:hypothetical protein A7982_13074 [Minicystis rosea]|nr:hypothetical protein A7982_13074 [Minicystis rosea]